MSFYWIKTNAIIKKIFSKYIWDLPNTSKKIYLTFDDGPTPEITRWVLEELHKHNAKATFFCIGKNIQNNPVLFKEIIDKGHSVGNHTFDHKNGWKTATEEYLNNVALCEEIILNLTKETASFKPTLFRPPYGRIKAAQAKKIRKRGYKIIMWDILSADFDNTITNEKCLKNVIENINPGSIIVFHDSIKAFNNLKYILPKILAYLDRNNFYCDRIEY